MRLLIDTEPSAQRYAEELDAYEDWFSISMAAVPSPWAVRTKSGIKQRVRLRRDDAVQPRRQQSAAIGPEWIQAKQNQLRSVVANGLVASSELKRFLVQLLGPGATSLGSTGLERGWWHHHICNTNRCASWATPAYRQYRAVVVWKSEVSAAIRKLRFGFGTAKYTNHEAESLADICEVLRGHSHGVHRQPLLIPYGTPRLVETDDINIGLDTFVNHMRNKGYHFEG